MSTPHKISNKIRNLRLEDLDDCINCLRLIFRLLLFWCKKFYPKMFHISSVWNFVVIWVQSNWLSSLSSDLVLWFDLNCFFVDLMVSLPLSHFGLEVWGGYTSFSLSSKCFVNVYVEEKDFFIFKISKCISQDIYVYIVNIGNI